MIKEVTYCNIWNTPDGLPPRIQKTLDIREFPGDELDELDIAVIMLRNHGYNHLADSVALARKSLTK